MALGNYVDLGDVQYPSVSGAYKQFESGLMGLAKMQEASAASAAVELQDRRDSSARMRQAEIDSQRMILEAAKEQRAADMEASKNLMELTKFQYEREEHDLKMLDLMEQRKEDRESKAFMRTPGVSEMYDKAQSLVPGEAAVSIAVLSGTGALSKMPKDKRDTLQPIIDGWKKVVVYYGDEKTDLFTATRLLSSGSSSDRVKGAAILLASGASEDTLSKNVKLLEGELNTAKKFVNQVSLDDDTVAKAMDEYKSSAQAISDYETIILTEKDKTKRTQYEAEILDEKRKVRKSREVLRARGMLDANGDVIYSADQLSAVARATDATAILDRLSDVTSPEHKSAYAGYYKALGDAMNLPAGTADEVESRANAIAAVKSAYIEPESLAERKRIILAAAKKYDESPSSASPQAIEAIKELTKQSAEVSALSRRAGSSDGMAVSTQIPIAGIQIAIQSQATMDEEQELINSGGLPQMGEYDNPISTFGIQGAPNKKKMKVDELVGMHNALVRSSIPGNKARTPEWISAMNPTQKNEALKALKDRLVQTRGAVEVPIRQYNKSGISGEWAMFADPEDIGESTATMLMSPQEIVRAVPEVTRAENTAKAGERLFYLNDRWSANTRTDLADYSGSSTRRVPARSIDGEEAVSMMFREMRINPSTEMSQIFTAAASGGDVSDSQVIVGNRASNTLTTDAVWYDVGNAVAGTGAVVLAAPAASILVKAAAATVGRGAAKAAADAAGRAIAKKYTMGRLMVGGSEIAVTAGGTPYLVADAIDEGRRVGGSGYTPPAGGAGELWKRGMYKARPGDGSDVDVPGFIPDVVPFAKNAVEAHTFMVIGGALNTLNSTDYAERINFAAGAYRAMGKAYTGAGSANIRAYLGAAGVDLSGELVVSDGKASLLPQTEALIREDAIRKGVDESEAVSRALSFILATVGTSGVTGAPTAEEISAKRNVAGRTPASVTPVALPNTK